MMRMLLLTIIFIAGIVTTPLFAKELDQNDLKEDIADGKLGRGWKSLNEVLNDANEGEKDPKVVVKNKQIVRELLGRNDVSKSFLIYNYNNELKNRLNGKDEVRANPAGTGTSLD